MRRLRGDSATTPRRLRDDSASPPIKNRYETQLTLVESMALKLSASARVCHPPIKPYWILPTTCFKLTMLNFKRVNQRTPLGILPVKILRGMGVAWGLRECSRKRCPCGEGHTSSLILPRLKSGLINVREWITFQPGTLKKSIF